MFLKRPIYQKSLDALFSELTDDPSPFFQGVDSEDSEWSFTAVSEFFAQNSFLKTIKVGIPQIDEIFQIFISNIS